tara:strand:- start:1926 stop:3059 length:1134 start_codon:yes stop_codon:yes gene_type:complete
LYCSRITLSDFRNFEHLNLELPNEPVGILGQNAQGKSNLLEAFLVLSIGRGRNNKSLIELIRYEGQRPADFARVRGNVHSNDQSHFIEVVFAPTEKDDPMSSRASRRFKLNGKSQRMSDLPGFLQTVHFAPDDADLLTGSPSIRRRFIDVSLSQMRTNYVRALIDYGRVLGQRNALLRNLKESRRNDSNQLEYWDGQILSLSKLIVDARIDFLARLSKIASHEFSALVGRHDDFQTRYFQSRPTGYENFNGMELFSRLRQKEVGAGMTLVGPHRDDVRLDLNRRPLSKFASRGEQRLAVLSLKLALMKLIGESGNPPVILLDDIFSELDPEHRELVANRILEGSQAFVSAADESQFPSVFLRKSRILKVSGGNAFWE